MTLLHNTFADNGHTAIFADDGTRLILANNIFSSAAIDRGAYMGVTEDIDGDSRPMIDSGLRPDIGADEFADRCATIEGWVFVDANGNGIYDEWWKGQRQGVGDVLITLNDGRTARTSVNGWYISSSRRARSTP